MTMHQWLSSLALDQIEALGGLEIDMDWWWPGHETDPVVSCEHLEIAGTSMTLQSTRSGVMLLNGQVVEPFCKVVR